MAKKALKVNTNQVKINWESRKTSSKLVVKNWE